MALFNKKGRSRIEYVEPPITIGPVELSDAAALIDHWDRSLGNSDATWAALEAIARRGGFVSAERVLTDMMSHGVSAEVAINKPWRWWAAASTAALNNGDYVLPARIFMFAKLFITHIAPTMNAMTQADVGLSQPAGDIYRVIASNCAAALAHLPPEHLIHDTMTGKVDVNHALALAKEAAGL